MNFDEFFCFETDRFEKNKCKNNFSLLPHGKFPKDLLFIVIYFTIKMFKQKEN